MVLLFGTHCHPFYDRLIVFAAAFQFWLQVKHCIRIGEEQVGATIITAAFNEVQAILRAGRDRIIVLIEGNIVRTLRRQEFRAPAGIDEDACHAFDVDKDLAIFLNDDVFPLIIIIDGEVADRRIRREDLALSIGRRFTPAIICTIVPDINAEIVRAGFI